MRLGPHDARVVAAGLADVYHGVQNQENCAAWTVEKNCKFNASETMTFAQMMGLSATAIDDVVSLCNELNANVSYPGYGTVKHTEAGSIYEVRRW